MLMPLTTMFWRDGLPTSRSYSDHECVNWDALENWVRSRMVGLQNPTILEQGGRWELISITKGESLKADDGEKVHP